MWKLINIKFLYTFHAGFILVYSTDRQTDREGVFKSKCLKHFSLWLQKKNNLASGEIKCNFNSLQQFRPLNTRLYPWIKVISSQDFFLHCEIDKREIYCMHAVLKVEFNIFRKNRRKCNKYKNTLLLPFNMEFW